VASTALPGVTAADVGRVEGGAAGGSSSSGGGGGSAAAARSGDLEPTEQQGEQWLQPAMDWLLDALQAEWVGGGAGDAADGVAVGAGGATAAETAGGAAAGCWWSE